MPYLSPKKRENVGRFLVVVDLGGGDRGIVDDLLVDELLALFDLRGGQRLEVGEVKTHPVGRLVRAELPDVRAKHLAQSPVDEVRRRMVAVDRPAAGEIDM